LAADGSRIRPGGRVTREACERLTRLGEAEQAAAAAFCVAVDENN
jgi:hypothetical protein